MAQQSAAPADPRFPLFHGVPAQPTNFVGREAILDRLVARLTQGDASVSAGGTGGAGKTTLAVKLAYDPRILAHFTEGVLWAALGKDPTIEAILADWALALNLDLTSFENSTRVAQAIKNAVGLRSILFIIDDVWDEAAANKLRCGGPNCGHLLTTRNDMIARSFAGPAATEKIPELEVDPALELLNRLAPEVCAAEPLAVRSLVKEVGGLPLAIELLGGYLGNPEKTGLPGLRAEALREMANPARRLRLARERLGGGVGERPTLEQTIGLSLEDLPERVIQAFYSLGAFSPKPDTFTLADASAVAGVEASCFGLLLNRNLIESLGSERLSIHPVIVAYARSKMSPDVVVWDHASKSNSNPHRRKWLEFYEQILPITEEKGDRRGLVVALNNIGHIHSAQGQRQKALEYYERALPITEEIRDRYALARTLDNIANVYRAVGQQQRALEFYERALSAMEELGARQGVAVVLHGMGLAYAAQGQNQRALECYERALPTIETVSDPARLGVVLYNMGQAYEAQRQPQKALQYYERALPIVEKEGDRSGVAATLNRIGRLNSAEGQTQKALEYFHRAKSISEEVGDRQELAVALSGIGFAYHHALGQYEEALRYYERVLPLVEELGHWRDVAATLNNMSSAFRAQGLNEKALEYHQRALTINER